MLRRHTRLSLPHSLHHLTTVTQARGNWFTRPSVCRGILEAFETCRADLNLFCIAYVLMPDHFHALVLQAPDLEGRPIRPLAYNLPIAELMRRFKRETSQIFRPDDYPPDTTLWHRRYNDVGVPGDAMWTKIRYIHNNPVKKHLTETPEAYPWSSAATFLTKRQGIIRVELDLIGLHVV